MDKTTEDLIELGRRLGRLEAENEALRKAASNGHTPLAKVPEPIAPPKAPEPPPLSTPSSMILELLTDSHPQEFNAHMVSIQLGIAKHIALETMEELTKNGFLKKVNVGRYVSKNSREKLERSSLMGTREIQPRPEKPMVANRKRMEKDSLTSAVLDYMEAHPDQPHSGISLLDVKEFRKYDQRILGSCAQRLSAVGRAQVIEVGWHGALASNKNELIGKVAAIKRLDHDPLQKAIYYNILNKNPGKSFTVDELVDMLPPVPPLNRVTTDEVFRAVRWLVTLRKVVSPEPNKYAKRSVMETKQ